MTLMTLHDRSKDKTQRAHSLAFGIALLQNSCGRICLEALEGSTETLCLTTIDRSIWFTLLFGYHLERGGAINTKYLGP